MSAPVVLVVEDDADIAESVSTILRERGLGCVWKRNGVDGLAWLRSRPEADQPCLVLLDAIMPEMNGWEFAAAIRATDRLAALPVVLMTGGRPGDVGNMTRVLRKPFSMADLEAICGEMCDPPNARAT